MKPIGIGLLIAAGLLGSTMAQAASISFSALPSDLKSFAPLGAATSGIGTYEENVTGNSSTRTSPFSDTTTHYDSAGANSIATFGQGPTETSTPVDGELRLAAFSDGPSSSSFGSGSGTFQFVWGTPDDYNNFSIYDNGILQFTTTGAAAPNGGLGTGSYLATVTGLGDYNGVRFESVGKNAFEFAGVSPVPLPRSLPMFAASLLALGAVGYAARRKAAVRG